MERPSMYSVTAIEKLGNLGGHASAGLPVKVLLNSGDLVDIRNILFSGMNGGEIHILAGPTEDDEDRDGRNEVYDLLQ